MSYTLVGKINGAAIIKDGKWYQLESQPACYETVEEVVNLAKEFSKYRNLLTDNEQVENMFQLGLVRRENTISNGIISEYWHIGNDFAKRGFWISTDGKLTIKAKYHHTNLHTEIDFQNRTIVFHPEGELDKIERISLTKVEEILGINIKNVSFTKIVEN